MLAISLRSVRQAAASSATVPPRRSSGPSSSSGCRRASAAPSPGFIAKKAPGTCMAFLPDYAELHALSNFSFLRGASHPEELVLRSHALGYRALALTDECSLAGAVRAHFAAKECGLPLIHGTEITVEKRKLILLATDRRSYGAISALITTGRRRSQKGTYSLTLADVAAVAASAGVLALW